MFIAGGSSHVVPDIRPKNNRKWMDVVARAQAKVLTNWLEDELTARLAAIDLKLEKMSQVLGTCVPVGPPPPTVEAHEAPQVPQSTMPGLFRPPAGKQPPPPPEPRAWLAPVMETGEEAAEIAEHNAQASPSGASSPSGSRQELNSGEAPHLLLPEMGEDQAEHLEQPGSAKCAEHLENPGGSEHPELLEIPGGRRSNRRCWSEVSGKSAGQGFVGRLSSGPSNLENLTRSRTSTSINGSKVPLPFGLTSARADDLMSSARGSNRALTWSKPSAALLRAQTRIQAVLGRAGSLQGSDMALPTTVPVAALASANSTLSLKSSPRSRGSASSAQLGRSVSPTSSTPVARRSSFREQVWIAMDDPNTSTMAWIYANLANPVILVSVLVPLMQTMPSPVLDNVVAAGIDISFDVLFMLDCLFRFVVYPKRRRFIFNLHNFIDLVAVTPLLLRAGLGWVVPEESRQALEGSILFCVVPVLRVLKSLRRFETFHLLVSAFEGSLEALPVLMFVFFVIALVFSSLIYLVEPRSNINSLPQALWLTIVSMTTVGYGDVVPKSAAGNCIVSVLVIVSLLYMAMPLGILGNQFNQTWNDRHRVLVITRTRERLHQCGFQAKDIPHFFKLFDCDHDGELNLYDFKTMISQMKLGLNDDRVQELFQCFDGDGSGSIDEKEFVRAIFPHDYDDLYNRRGAVSKRRWSIT